MVKQIMTLKNGKSTGLDQISVRLLKGGATVLSEHLTYLFNMSITNAEVPEMWKVKRVSPIFKSGSKLSCSNYRPISIQPIPLKLLEQVINEQLSKFLSDHDLLNIHQSGFRRNHSTATAVIDVTDYILEKMKSNYVGAVFLDLTKAFDSIDHNIFYQKLKKYGIRDTEHKWFMSYLSGRQQLTMVNDKRSEQLPEESYGIPQGSVLGPVLFLLYINDIVSAVNCKIHLYADDTILVHHDSNSDVLQSGLNSELDQISIWLKTNKLTLIADKSKYMLFGSKRKLKKLSNFELKITGEILKRTDTYKYLVSLLNWSKHINETAGKALRPKQRSYW